MAETRRMSMKAGATLNLILGILIFVTPWIAVGLQADGEMLWSNLIAGTIIAVLALVTLSTARSPRGNATGSAAVNALVGAWVFVSAFLYNVNTTYFLMNLIFGGVVAVVSAMNAFAATSRTTARRA